MLELTPLDPSNHQLVSLSEHTAGRLGFVDGAGALFIFLRPILFIMFDLFSPRWRTWATSRTSFLRYASPTQFIIVSPSPNGTCIVCFTSRCRASCMTCSSVKAAKREKKHRFRTQRGSCNNDTADRNGHASGQPLFF